MLMKYRCIVVILLYVFLLTSCASSSTSTSPPMTSTQQGMLIGAAGGAVVGSVTDIGVPMGAAVGGIMGGAYGDYQARKTSSLKTLLDNGVQIIPQGDSTLFIFAADRCFNRNVASFNQYCYSIMQALVSYLNAYESVSVKVESYTDSAGLAQRNLALSQAQAQNIANYMAKHGLDTRILYAMGYGMKDPIADNRSYEGRAQNRRIEITMTRVVPGE